MVSDNAQYTGQSSGLIATEHTRIEIILFSIEFDLTVFVQPLTEQRPRALGVSLACGNLSCDKE
jgi:hypothetical protein